MVSGGARLPDGFVRGTNHAHIHRRGHGYGSDASARAMDDLVRHGVNWIALTRFAFQATSKADGLVGYGPHSVVGRVFRDRSLTEDDVVREVQQAHARHIKVAIKPHVWAGDFGNGAWHGTIQQESAEAHLRWWQSYRAYVLEDAALAARAGADALVLGTELVQMSKHESEWRGLIRDVRAVYSGPLTYAAHWDTEVDAVAFWDALDVVGVSAYFPLQAPDGASVEVLQAAWRPHRARLDALAARHGKPIVFLELGFRGVAGTHRTPWDTAAAPPDPSAQARAYEATFRALQDAPWWRGALLWKSFTDPSLADEGGDGVSYAFVGTPAGDVIRAWFGR